MLSSLARGRESYRQQLALFLRLGEWVERWGRLKGRKSQQKGPLPSCCRPGDLTGWGRTCLRSQPCSFSTLGPPASWNVGRFRNEGGCPSHAVRCCAGCLMLSWVSWTPLPSKSTCPGGT